MSEAALAHSTIRVPWGAWHWDIEHSLRLPVGWQVEMLQMAGRSGLSALEIGAALDDPTGAPTLEKLVAGVGSVSIAIDDVTRPTKTAPILEALIDRLSRAGVRDEQITVVIASGAHLRATPVDVDLKIGQRLLGRVRVVSHDPNGDLADTGVTLANTRIRLNPAFFRAECRIGIGCVMPHPFAAFSGGGKIVVPGLADLDVLACTHKYALMGFHGGADLDTNRFRRDMESAVQAIGLHWTVNVVTNATRDAAFIAAGDMIAAHRSAAAAADQCGRTAEPKGRLDALLVNAYPKDAELLQIEAALVPLRAGMLQWLAPGAPVVLMAGCPKGLGSHGLFGPDGRLFRVPTERSFLRRSPLIIYCPGVERANVELAFWSGYTSHRTWEGVLCELEARLPPRAAVGVLPCGPLQTIGRTAVVTR